MEKKKCPIIAAGIFANSQDDVTWHDDADACRGAECGWWLDDGCIEIAEVKELYRLRQAVEKLADVVRNHA